MKKAFTIVELLLAISLMVVLMATSGVVFRTAVKAHRTASATAEIARKLRGITDQLNADFKSLRKDGIIFFAWSLAPVDIDGNVLYPGTPGFSVATVAGYKRFDGALFFATGDFQTYNEWPYLAGNNQVIHDNLARICYTLADNAVGKPAQAQEAQERILARSQHILVSDPDIDRNLNADGITLATVPDFPDLANIPIPLQLPPNADYVFMNNNREYDWAMLSQWNNASLDQLVEMFTVATGIKIPRTWAAPPEDPRTNPDPTEGGLGVDVSSRPPLNIHQLLCEGVGDFSVQGWYEDPVLGPRWYPEVDLNGDGVFAGPLDTDFNWDNALGMIDTNDLIWVLYNPAIDDIITTPGLGRALKFTFTLY
ncbi:MAG: hypothetical protein J7M40_02160, partial [Planctomycetes bacterium]|nr:hypothetical protein [Planctomycetota bacterium]